MKRAALFLCVLLPAIFFGCSSSEPGADAGDGGASGDAGDGGASAPSNKEDCKSGVLASYGPGDRLQHAAFDSAAFPFPNNYYTVKDDLSPTGIRLNYPGDTMPFYTNEQFGFSTFANLMQKFYTADSKYDGFTVSVDESTLPKKPDDTLSPDWGIFTVPRADFLDRPKSEFGKFAAPLYVFTNQKIGMIFAQGRAPLREDTDYIFVITKKIKVNMTDKNGTRTAAGTCIAAPEHFRAVRQTEPLAATNPFAALEPLRQSLAPLFARLESEYGIPRNQVVTLSEFHTSVNRSEVLKARGVAEKTEVQNVKITGAVIPLNGSGKPTPEYLAHVPCAEDDFKIEEYEHSSIEAMVTGTFDAPQFCCVKDRFSRDPSTGEYKVLGNETLEFLLFLPKAQPAKGIVPPYKLVVFHHAFQVCKETLMGLAGELARFGYASASFDMVGHGSRAHQPNCEDGRLFCDTQALTFIKPNDISATVSYLEQTLLDDLAFAKMLKGLQLDVQPVKGDPATGKVDLTQSGDGSPDLDTVSPFGFISQSLGSYLGVPVVALEPHYDRAVFNVGLGAFYKFIIDGISPGSDLNMLDEGMSTYVAGIQTACDPVESLNYANYMTKSTVDGRSPVNVLFQGALNDEVIPHSGTDLITYWMGLEQVDARRVVDFMPQVSSSRTGSYMSEAVTLGYWQTTPAEHVHFLTSKYPGVRQSVQFQAASFIRTAMDGKGGGKGGTIINPFSCAQSEAMVTRLQSSGLTVEGNTKWCK